jgi:hypothetical protein
VLRSAGLATGALGLLAPVVANLLASVLLMQVLDRRGVTDALLSGADPTGEVATGSEAVAEVAEQSAVTSESPLVLVDERVPVGQSGFTGAPASKVNFPFFSGHHHRHR